MVLARRFPEELTDLRDTMDRLMEEALSLHRRLWGFDGGVRRLPIAVYETPHEVVVKAYAPGARPEDVHISWEQGALTIRAHIPEPFQGTEEPRWYHQELFWGDFVRTVALPASLEVDRAEATFADGVLTLVIPKVEEARPKEIPVRVAARV